MEATTKSVQCISPTGLHKIAYKEWGDPANPKVLVCVHGLTRVCDDFDKLAPALADQYRVVCPDVVGRGRSGRLRNPQMYRVPQYVSDSVTLIARVLANTGCETLDWFGTSMGGLIGMALASMPDSPIGKLVLNDIGPTLDAAALHRIGDYVGQDTRFDTFEEAANYVRAISLSFGEHTEQEWHKLAADVLLQDEQGKWMRHYDIGLAEPFRTTTVDAVKADEATLWAMYDAIACPTMVVRGANSDLLSQATAQQMAVRGPKATLVEFANVGHAPTFVHADQIAAARAFLLG